MYYLSKINIESESLGSSNFERLVKAKDKNNAYDKIKWYLEHTYISNLKNTTYRIEIVDTID